MGVQAKLYVPGLVMSGGMGKLAINFYQRLSSVIGENIGEKKDIDYSTAKQSMYLHAS